MCKTISVLNKNWGNLGDTKAAAGNSVVTNLTTLLSDG